MKSCIESAKTQLMKYLRNIENFQKSETSLLIYYVIRCENKTSLDSSCQALQIIGAFLNFKLKTYYFFSNFEI